MFEDSSNRVSVVGRVSSTLSKGFHYRSHRESIEITLESCRGDWNPMARQHLGDLVHSIALSFHRTDIRRKQLYGPYHAHLVRRIFRRVLQLFLQLLNRRYRNLVSIHGTSLVRGIALERFRFQPTNT